MYDEDSDGGALSMGVMAPIIAAIIGAMATIFMAVTFINQSENLKPADPGFQPASAEAEINYGETE